MAIISQSRIWNGINVRADTNTETGAVYVYAPGSTILSSDALIFTSEGKSRDWKVQNPRTVARLFNNKNDRESTPEELTSAFEAEGYKVFDNDRAAVLNNPNNYQGKSAEEIKSLQKAFAENKLPGVKDPDSGIAANSEGEIPDQNTEGEEQETLDDGSGDIEDSDEDPNVFNDDRAPGGTKSLSAPGATLRFPKRLGPREGIDYITITPIEYDPKGPSGDALIDSGFGTKDTGATIFLPMQPALGEMRGMNWNKDKMDFMAQSIAGGAMGGMEAAAAAFRGDAAAAEAAIKKAAGDVGTDIQDAANNPLMKPFIKSYFAGKIVGSNIFARQTGAVVNPNLELLFEGPELRTFNFSWKLTPRDREETQIIRAIIKILKKTSAPKGKQGQIFLKTPDIYKLEYRHAGGQHPFLNKFKPCALTTMAVDYTPDGSYMTYGEDAGMTSYGLNLSFTEIMPIYDRDYASSSNDMGF